MPNSTGQRSHDMGKNEPRQRLLEGKLRELEEVFKRTMLARGFDPQQIENVPLTPTLARLQAEREELMDELMGLRIKGTGDKAEKKSEVAMTEVERIQDQLKRAFEGDAWHGPSVQQILKDVSASQAAARPIAGAHSIWEIALHIAAWESAGRRRLVGDRAELPDEENWPPVIDTTEEAWNQTRAALEQGHRALQQEISRLEESRLEEPILDGLSSVYVTLHGVIQHDLYHAGQIAILKKAVTEDQ